VREQAAPAAPLGRADQVGGEARAGCGAHLAIGQFGQCGISCHPPGRPWAGILIAEQLAKVGVEAGLVRLSLGVEDADDLVADVLSSLSGS